MDRDEDNEGKSGNERKEEMIWSTWFWLKSVRELGAEEEGGPRRSRLLGFGASMTDDDKRKRAWMTDKFEVAL